jgi:hypothetical protein
MVYYNTTTVPMYLPESHIYFLNMSLIVIGFFSVTAVMSESLLQWIKYRDFGGKIGEGEDEDEGEGEDEKKSYTEKYNEEYANLKECDLNKLDFLNLNTRYVKEETPGGEVIMSYDKELDCFLYYTDNLKEITYAILETVARKFVIENDCKNIYNVCSKPAEAEALKVEAAGDTDSDNVSVSSDEVVVEEKPVSVFAKFKKYNTGGKGSVPNFKAVIDVVEQTNHFRFKGKLYDYEEIVKQNETARKAKETSKPLDYAAYKKQLLENSKKESKKEV